MTKFLFTLALIISFLSFKGFATEEVDDTTSSRGSPASIRMPRAPTPVPDWSTLEGLEAFNGESLNNNNSRNLEDPQHCQYCGIDSDCNIVWSNIFEYSRHAADELQANGISTRVVALFIGLVNSVEGFLANHCSCFEPSSNCACNPPAFFTTDEKFNQYSHVMNVLEAFGNTRKQNREKDPTLLSCQLEGMVLVERYCQRINNPIRGFEACMSIRNILGLLQSNMVAFLWLEKAFYINQPFKGKTDGFYEDRAVRVFVNICKGITHNKKQEETDIMKGFIRDHEGIFLEASRERKRTIQHHLGENFGYIMTLCRNETLSSTWKDILESVPRSSHKRDRQK